jgi:hypothetical protein
MNDSEAERIYETLMREIGATQLRWVAEEIQEQIAIGNLEEKKITIIETDDQEQGYAFPSQSRSRKATVTGSIEFAGKEKLRLLLSALHRATAESASIEDRLAGLISADFPKELREDAWSIAEFSFQDQTDREKIFISTVASRSSLLNSVKDLAPLIEELQGEINAD